MLLQKKPFISRENVTLELEKKLNVQNKQTKQ